MKEGGQAGLRAAATLVILREAAANDLELLLMRRPETMRSFGGMWVFPGGKFEAADVSALALQRLDVGPTAPSATELGFRAAALRETFEETGLLLGAPDARDALLGRRPHFLHDATRFYAALAELGVCLDAWRCVPLGHWITPAAVRARFDTHFFVVRAGPLAAVSAEPSEAAAVEWRTLTELAATVYAAPPVFVAPTAITILELRREFARASDVDTLMERMRQRPIAPVLPKLLQEDGAAWAVMPWDEAYPEIPGEGLTMPGAVCERYAGLPARLRLPSAPGGNRSTTPPKANC